MAPSLSTLLIFPVAIAALTLDCKNIRADSVSFDLSPLAGPKEVHEQHRTGPHEVTNTTFTLDICTDLAKPSYIGDGEDFCSRSTRVCGVERVYNPTGSGEVSVVEIAGEYTATKGGGLEPKITRLKNSESHSDSAREGLRMELNGGRSMEGQKQRASIEFICDTEVTGNEGFEESEEEALLDARTYGEMQSRRVLHPREEGEGGGDGDGGEHEQPLPDLDAGKSIQFVSYQEEKGGVKVLRLTWKTKYACENAINEPKEPTKSSGWGFFTWLLIIVFLLAAAYIIFGSWLNYNRYGARGWDLIPHGDTIRDLPYIIKDWSTSVADKVRGGGGLRGGYSAV